MAMITCPNCGEQIWDKAKSCVHCGVSLQPEEKMVCEECGAELEGGIEICPACGCPVAKSGEEATDVPQQVEVTGVRMTKKAKKIVLLVGGAIILIAAVILGIGMIQKKKAADEAQKAKKEYAANLNTITYTMLDASGIAEDCGNLIKSVWSNSIYEESDEETDEYTKEDGYFVSDFNEALGNLFADSAFSNKVKSVSEKQDTVNSLLKKLNNPPQEYKEAYDKMKEFYDAYITLSNLATNPSGNLQTYSNSFSEADTKVLNCYKAMQVYLEE